MRVNGLTSNKPVESLLANKSTLSSLYGVPKVNGGINELTWIHPHQPLSNSQGRVSMLIQRIHLLTKNLNHYLYEHCPNLENIRSVPLVYRFSSYQYEQSRLDNVMRLLFSNSNDSSFKIDVGSNNIVNSCILFSLHVFKLSIEQTLRNFGIEPSKNEEYLKIANINSISSFIKNVNSPFIDQNIHDFLDQEKNQSFSNALMVFVVNLSAIK